MYAWVLNIAGVCENVHGGTIQWSMMNSNSWLSHCHSLQCIILFVRAS